MTEEAPGESAPESDDRASRSPASGTAADEPDDGPEEDAYNGVFGAFPYAIRTSESRLFKSYGVVGGLLAAIGAFMFALSLIGVVASTTGTTGGTFSFSRAFIIFVGMLVVFPLMAPILSVARRHRRSASTPRYDAAVGLGGYVFVFSLYLTLLLSIPPEQQEPVSGVTAPIVEVFYDLPAISGLVPPIVAVVLLYLVHRRLA
ncbi:hypothetical protein [Halorientalis salina]|uniref:hypothetical protein n=1 Tax=Halorientalis salina TaxID=2932266 RepID=UPI002022B4F9|nr:hypothetical protein [Halorientalis salina]